MSINRAILLGLVGRDPELRTMPNGDQVASFSLATTDRWRDRNTNEMREATEWHQVVCHNQAIAKIIAEHVRKGTKVSVEGKIKTREWQDRDGGKRRTTEIVIGRFDGGLTLEGAPKSQDGAGRTPADDDSIPY